jgi:predicted secreted protein
MSVGIGIIGRQVAITIGSQTILGVQTKGLSVNNERLDTSDDAAAGWAEALATSGQKSVELPISGLLKNLELLAAYFAASQIFAATVVYPDGSEVEGDFFLESFSETGEYNGLKTFDATFSSSGAVTFTAGV